MAVKVEKRKSEETWKGTRGRVWRERKVDQYQAKRSPPTGKGPSPTEARGLLGQNDTSRS